MEISPRSCRERFIVLATEFGVYTSVMERLLAKAPGTPTISFRDLVIQKRENDLVAASFGRGFFVLDDYSALRGMMNKENLDKTAKLFKPKDAKLFKPRNRILVVNIMLQKIQPLVQFYLSFK